MNTHIITIMGASGRVGSKTTQLLLEKGFTLRLVGRSKQGLDSFKNHPNVEIHEGDSSNVDFLSNSLKGASVALLMIPAGFQQENVTEYQDQLGLAQMEAIKRSGIKKIVFLSSVGGHSVEKTGIVSGLARQELRLKELSGIDISILRPTYFLENLLGNIGMIKGMGINGGAIQGDVSFPMIATKDIAAVVADHLANPTFEGIQVQALLGAKDYTLNEVTSLIGSRIGKSDLNYVTFDYDSFAAALVQAGFSTSMAESYKGLSEGINLGIFNVETRDSKSTTLTTAEEFLDDVFVPIFNS
jgi:uncharacterized protein YbjT (DUF2867 family)